MKNIFLSIFVIIILASCSSVATSKKLGSSQPSIAGSNWVLSDNVKGVSVPTLKIQDGKINGNASCNDYFGELVMDSSKGSFSVGKMAVTKKVCSNISVEVNFLEMLSQTNKYVVNGTTLELYKDNLLLMKLNKSE